jgi:hypothetical protein
LTRGFIQEEEAAYLKLLLEDRDPENNKIGLQRLCKFYRSGLRLRYPHAFRVLLNGLLYSQSSKVVRWAFAAAALVGRKAENLQAVIDAVERNKHDPEMVVYGVPALYKLSTADEVRDLLRQQGIPIEGAVLVASAQYNSQQKVAVARSRVNIHRADPLELRMATLLIGMDKAPENLFDTKHVNRAVIGQLNRHDDDLVAQYSIWAIAENPLMGIDDLGVSVKDIENMPPNVRSWMYRLVVANDETALAHLEYVRLGSEDFDVEARNGLASGLRHIYFDGLDEIIFAWLPDEENHGIKGRLLEHMSACAHRCSAYETTVLAAYREGNRFARTQLEAAAQGSGLYASLRRIALADEQGSLNFGEPREVSVVVNQNINTGGGNIGAVVGEGNVIAQSIEAVNRMKAGSDVKPLLEAVLKLIEQKVTSAQQRDEGAALVAEAAEKPNASVVGRIIGWLKSLKEGTDLVAGASHSIGDLVHKAQEISSSLS